MTTNARTLEARIQELEKADKAKDHFLALLSHELRNHIHAIRTNVWLIKARNRDHEIARPSDAIDRQVVKLTRLVEDLLDVIRVTRKSALCFETLPLQQIVGAAVVSTQDAADAHRRELSVELPDKPIYVAADAPRLQQAIGNILNNAIKYSPQQGEIHIRLTEDGGHAVLSVKDRGIGIAAEEIGALFRPFGDVPTRKPGAEGLGIGLHVARELIESHRGSIEAKSEGRGKGAEFVVRLPVAEAPAEVRAQAAAAEPARDDASLSILVVDDNRDAADSLAQVLQAHGHRVTAAYGGEEALHVAEKGDVQVALVDIGMPTVDGFQVAERISRSPAGRDTLLVAVTGWGDKADRSRSKAAGFAYHLTKPVDFDTLDSLLSTAARRTHAPHAPQS